MRNILTQTLTVCATACVLTFVTGCKTNDHDSTQASAQPAPAMATPTAPTAPAAAAPAATTSAAPALKAGADGIYRVDAGSSEPFTDSAGHVWQAEVGIDGGDVIERDASTQIANTKDAGLFLSEHYSMNSFSASVPNGKYIAKLYFAETYDGITDVGQRVFSYNVNGQHEVKDLDLFKTAGANHAYVDSVPVEVTNGKFTITFTPNVENPEINAIELDPQH